MVYLVVIVLVAAVGLGRLWWIQRSRTTTVQSVEGFRSSLERLSGPHTRSGGAVSAPRDRHDTPEGKTDPYTSPLDPERRAAAKRRIEARRRSALRSTDLRSQ